MHSSTTIVGRLGRDPESKTTDKGLQIVKFGVATNHFSDKDHTEWFNVTVFGDKATRCMEYLTKGSRVLVEGRLKSREFEDKNGIKRKYTDLLANTVQFMDTKKDSEVLRQDAPAVVHQSRHQESTNDVLPF